MSVSGSVLFQLSKSPVIVLRSKYPSPTCIHIIQPRLLELPRFPVILLIVAQSILLSLCPQGSTDQPYFPVKVERLWRQEREGVTSHACHSFDCQRKKTQKWRKNKDEQRGRRHPLQQKHPSVSLIRQIFLPPWLPQDKDNEDFKVREANIKKKNRVRRTVQSYPVRDDQTALDRV